MAGLQSICSVHECGKAVHGHGLCNTHYRQLQRSKIPPRPPRQKRMSHCQDCGRVISRYGTYCRGCMNQHRGGGYARQPISERFTEKIKRVEIGCWLWGGTIDRIHGYGKLSVPKGWAHGAPAEKDWSFEQAHRVAWVLASGQPIPAEMQVCHTCDVRLCGRNDEHGTYEVDGIEYERWGHLFLAPQLANMKDMHEKGRYQFQAAHGTRNSHAKLTPEQAAEIRQRYALPEHLSMKAIGADYGIGLSQTRRIIRYQHWSIPS